MSKKLENYVLGKWIAGDGEGSPLYNAIDGLILARASTKGIPFADVLDYGRKHGGNPLRRMTFHERGRMLKALAMYLMEKKDQFYELSFATGATRADSWVDIEGGIGNLFAYSSLRRQFPDKPFYVDGEMVKLSKSGSFVGHHIMVPKEGIAIHINAFNFPVWGMLEKIAVNLLAGVPCLVKPATITSFLTEAVVREIIESKILPEGSLQLICGSADGLLDHVDIQDVVTFTGSASTGMKLKAHPAIISNAVPFNMEADSLNSAVLAPSAAPGSPEFDLFVKEVRKEMTLKCGQRCTAIRRILVHENYTEDFIKALSVQLAKTVIGDPRREEVRMGALAGKAQVLEVQSKLDALLSASEIVYGEKQSSNILADDSSAGAFFSPVLLLNSNPLNSLATHEIEAFGPISTVIPYRDLEQAIAITKLGKGSLVSTIATYNDKEAEDFVINAAAYHGRILVLNRESAPESTGHGSPMPMLVHGGPGRAGGGEEMGGKRGVLHYLQRTAIQGSPTSLSSILGVYQYGAIQREAEPHLFRQHFEDLKIGDTVTTHKHTVTEADIANFANVSGDNFYAHVDATSLEGTIFERRVAHGYYVLSKAAGMFVDPRKGPVLLNYGIEECRFTKPVYPGMTIGVRLTVREKIAQEKRNADDITKGIVKFMVDVYDETGETVALATILTMVKMRDQN